MLHRRQTEKDVLEHVQGCLLGMVAGAWLNAITREYSPSEKAFSSLVWNIPFTWEPDDGIELALALANSLIKEKMFKPEVRLLRLPYVDALKAI